MSNIKDRINKLKEDTKNIQENTDTPTKSIRKPRKKVGVTAGTANYTDDQLKLFAYFYVSVGFIGRKAAIKFIDEYNLSIKDPSQFAYRMLKYRKTQEFVKNFKESLYENVNFTVEDIILQYQTIIQEAEAEGDLKLWKDCIKEMSKLLGHDKVNLDITSNGQPIIQMVTTSEAEDIMKELNIEDVDYED